MTDDEEVALARVGKESLEMQVSDPHDELLAGITEHANQVYGRVLIEKGILDPHACDFVAAGLELRIARATKGLPELPHAVVVGTFLYLVPDFER